MNKNSILKSTIIIAGAGVLAKIIGVFFRIILTREVGEVGIGLFSYPMTFFLLLNALTITGIPIAVSKLISENGTNKLIQKNIFKIILNFMSVIGLLLTVLLLISSKFFLRYWPEDTYYSFLALSISPLFLSPMSVIRGYFQGLEKMFPFAISQVVESFGRASLGLFFAHLFLFKGLKYAVAGAELGTGLGAFLGLVVIAFLYKKQNISDISLNIDKKDKIKIIKDFLKIAIPISIGVAGAPLMNFLDSLIIPIKLTLLNFSENSITSMWGVLSSITTITALPLTFSVAVAASVVPNISSGDLKNVELIKTKIRSSLILIISIALPSALGLFILAKPIFLLFFPTLPTDNYLMEIMSISIIFIMINQVFVGILQAMNHPKIPVRNIYIGVIIKIILSYILISIPSINIHGAVISTLITYSVILLLNIISCKKIINFKFDIKYMIIIPLINSLLMAIVVITTHKIFSNMFGDKSLTIISILSGAIIYGILLIVTKVVSINSIPILNKIGKTNG